MEQLQSVPVVDLACAAATASEVDAALLLTSSRAQPRRGRVAHRRAVRAERRLFATRRMAVSPSTRRSTSATLAVLARRRRLMPPPRGGRHPGGPHDDQQRRDGWSGAREDPLAGATLRWPPGLPGYERTLRRYFAGAYALSRRLNALLFDALGVDAPTRASSAGPLLSSSSCGTDLPPPRRPMGASAQAPTPTGARSPCWRRMAPRGCRWSSTARGFPCRPRPAV